MNFAEHPPSKEWAALKYRGEKIADVWFKPDGDPCALTFRIPEKSFHIPELGQLLTLDNLLKAVAIAKEEVETCRPEVAPVDGAHLDLAQPLPPPPPDAPHLDIHVRLKPPVPDGGSEGGEETEFTLEKWQELVARWDAILGLEASMDTLRLSMEGLRSEMEAATSKALTADEKVHALNADVAQWNQAKTRVIYALPKVRDFIHRSTWAKGTPERKKLEEFFKEHTKPPANLAQLDEVQRMVENCFKDRQQLSAIGVTVNHEGKSLVAHVQGILRTLQMNAETNARRKREAARKKGKFI